jgi:hypothetical protein
MTPLDQADSSTVAKLPQPTQAKGGIAELAAAYVAAWGEIDNVVKNADNPHFGSQYADLGAVLDTIRPVFARHDLALLTAPAEMDGDKLSLSWMLLHKTGQNLSGRMQIPTGKATAQAVGSAVTYMRRYLGAAIGGVAQVDDDGNAASAQPPAKSKPGTPKASASPPAGPSYAESLEAILERISGAQTTPELEGLRVEIAELGDQKAADAYVAKKRALKQEKK